MPSRVTRHTSTTKTPATKTPKSSRGATTPKAFGKHPAKPAAATSDSGTVSASRTGAPKALGSIIDGANQQLYVRLNHLDDATTAKLLKAQERGVDTHVVLSPGAKLDQFEVQRVLALTDSGVDLKVVKRSGLTANTGVADTSTFTGTGSTSKDPSALKTSVAAFEGELKVDLKKGPGLLGPEQVKLHPMPDDGAGPIVDAVNAAKKSIDLEVYQLADPNVVDALEAAAKRGVNVRIMIEPKALEPSNYSFIAKRLTAAGVQMKPTPPQFDTHGNVDHAKFMVVDNKELLFGTGNLVRVGLGGNEQNEANNHDFWVEDTQAESLKEAGTLFDADWNRTATTGVTFKNLVVTPDDDEPDIFSVMDSAKAGGHLKVYNQSLSDKDTVQKLLDAKKRGVNVQVLLGAFQDKPGLPPSNDKAVKTLRAAGIDVKYMTSSYLHAKAVVTDDTAFLGSQNFTGGGLVQTARSERFQQAALVKQLNAQFDSDYASPGAQP